MGVRTAYDPIEDIAIAYDSVTGWAFGPIFEHDGGTERLEAFLDSIGGDPRKLDDAELVEALADWNRANPREEEAG